MGPNLEDTTTPSASSLNRANDNAIVYISLFSMETIRDHRIFVLQKIETLECSIRLHCTLELPSVENRSIQPLPPFGLRDASLQDPFAPGPHYDALIGL